MSVDQRDLTVAHVREPAGANFVEVVFLESARFYRLARSHRAFDRVFSALKRAEAAQRTVTITFAALNGADIEDVQSL